MDDKIAALLKKRKPTINSCFLPLLLKRLKTEDKINIINITIKK